MNNFEFNIRNCKIKHLRRHLAFVSVFFAYVFFLQVTEIYSPLTYLFGIPTPTTGITRSLIALFKGDIKLAFSIHPLFSISIPFGASVYCYLFYRKEKFLKISIIFAIIFFIVYIIRVANGTIYY